jgi:hypothetical protein
VTIEKLFATEHMLDALQRRRNAPSWPAAAAEFTSSMVSGSSAVCSPVAGL